MNDAYLGLGSNLGDRHRHLRGAVDAVARLPGTSIAAASPIYETLPMGPDGQSKYLNMAARIETRIPPEALIDHLQQIEKRLGRAPLHEREPWGPREIDIDLLLYADHVIDTMDLRVPHPGLAQRWFVLRPMTDLAPDLSHPTLGRTMRQLLEDVEAGQASDTSKQGDTQQTQQAPL